MKLAEIHHSFLQLIVITVVFLLGFHGFGHSMNLHNPETKMEVLTHRDSLIIEMVTFIQPENKLTKDTRKHIENRIKLFPNKIIRRDTLNHFLNTAYAIAYYEFVKHDFKKAKRLSEQFAESSMPPGFFSYFFHYSSIGLNASTSLTEKGKLKTTKDKNSWYTPIKFEWSDSLNWDFKRSFVDFLDSFLDDMPTDCALTTYRELLTAYHKGGGRLELLNGYSRRGFIQRCLDADRKDILDIIYGLWDVCFEDFHKNGNGYLEYKNPTLKLDSIAIAKTYNEILSFDVNINKHQIDSIIAIGTDVDLSPRIMRLANLYFNQSRFQELVDACERLSPKVSGKSLNTLHNYWALGLSNLGRYEEALHHYDHAIKYSTDQRIISSMRLNKACTLGEMGRTEEAVEIFMKEKDVPSTPFEKFVWYDNLGYVYNFSDPSIALYYYDCAERYLDSGSMDSDRKIRHFCRKAKVLNHNSYLQRNSIEKAMDYTRQYGCSDVGKGMAYSELAAFTSSSFDYKEADRLFQTAHQHYQKLADSDLRKISFNRQFASNLYLLDQRDESLQLLDRQLEIVRQSYGKHHVEYSKILCSIIQLACLHSTTGVDIENIHKEFSILAETSQNALNAYEIAKTEIAYLIYSDKWQDALHTAEDALSLPLNPMQKLSIIQQYEAIARDNLNQAEYINRMNEMISTVKVGMIGGLLTLSGGKERALSRPLSDIIDGALAKGANEVALQLCLFRKGLLYTKKKTIERKLAIKRSLKKVSNRLQVARQELNNAVAYNDSIHIPELTANVFRLERELGNRLSSEKKLYSELERTLAQVAQRLSYEDLAVEFVKYSVGKIINYGAFLIDRNGMKEFVRIGTEEDILSNPSIVWTWMPDYTDGYENLYFCPDGVLNRLGVEYLSSDGLPSYKQIKFHRVFHLSEIYRVPCEIGNNVVVVGVSDHNSPINDGDPVDRGNWTDLPNVEYEIELISKNIYRDKLTILLNNQATEQNVSGLSGDEVSTLHFSSHGFYRNYETLSQAALDSSNEDYHVARRFLSGGLTEVGGIVLRQGNISWQSPYILDENDDLLTAEEIELLSFPKLNLTVLSTCESGLGEIDDDGVWGLQRAFRIAGTKNLICTLTKVDDYWAAQFMDVFYEKAAHGNNIYDSFQSAQQWIRRELPDNPEIWSSFILIE